MIVGQTSLIARNIVCDTYTTAKIEKTVAAASPQDGYKRFSAVCGGTVVRDLAAFESPIYLTSARLVLTSNVTRSYTIKVYSGGEVVAEGLIENVTSSGATCINLQSLVPLGVWFSGLKLTVNAMGSGTGSAYLDVMGVKQ